MDDIASDTAIINRRDLFDRIWSKPMTTNAAELNVGSFALAALARRLRLPLPRAGHWMKKAVGKEPSTPDFPADALLDGKTYTLPAPGVRHAPRPATARVEAALHPDTAGAAEPDCSPSTKTSATTEAGQAAQGAAQVKVTEHKKIAGTRTAIHKSSSTDRVSTGGRGKFRLLVTPSTGERACSILDRLVSAVEARGWSLENMDLGYAIVADGETVGLMIEEKLDRVPHVVTAAELKEKADYERKCALADRGIGYRPWREPSIPQHDLVPNGELVLKFDHNYDAGGTRRTFSDGKRQQLGDLIPSMIDSLERWSVAVKAKREERAQWKRDWEEQDRRRKDLERQARVEGYRIAFLQRQVERKREIDGLAGLIGLWDQTETSDPKFAELVELARLYQARLEAKLTPDAVAKRIAELKLMDDDVYIYDPKRLD